MGGSDAAAALGLSKLKTPYKLYLDKVMPVVDEDSDKYRWGNLLEPAVLKAYSEDTGFELQMSGENTIVRHPNIDWLFCTPDAIAIDKDCNRRNVQAKTAYNDYGWGTPFTDEIPLEYRVQVQHEMCVLGLEVSDVPVLIGGQDFRIYTVHRSNQDVQNILKAEEMFWKRVKDRNPPAPINLEDAKLRWQKSLETTMDVDDTVLEEWRGLMLAKEKIKEWEERKEFYELRLKKVMQDAEVLLYQGKKICSWKNQDRNAISQKKLEAEFPEVADACRETDSIRVFRTSKVKSLAR